MFSLRPPIFFCFQTTILISNLSLQMSNLENHNPQVIRQISKEVKTLTTGETLEGIKICVNESNLTDIQALIDGPGILWKTASRPRSRVNFTYFHTALWHWPIFQITHSTYNLHICVYSFKLEHLTLADNFEFVWHFRKIFQQILQKLIFLLKFSTQMSNLRMEKSVWILWKKTGLQI